TAVAGSSLGASCLAAVAVSRRATNRAAAEARTTTRTDVVQRARCIRRPFQWSEVHRAEHELTRRPADPTADERVNGPCLWAATGCRARPASDSERANDLALANDSGSAHGWAPGSGLPRRPCRVLRGREFPACHSPPGPRDGRGRRAGRPGRDRAFP